MDGAYKSLMHYSNEVFEDDFLPIRLIARETGVNPYVIYLWTQIGLLRAYHSKEIKSLLKEKTIEELRELVEDGRDPLNSTFVRWQEAYELAIDPLLVSATQEVIDVLPFYRHPDRLITLLAQKFAVRLGLIPMDIAAKILQISVKNANVLTKRRCTTVKIAGRRFVVPDVKWLSLVAERRGAFQLLDKEAYSPVEFLSKFVGRIGRFVRRRLDWLAQAEILCYTHEGNYLKFEPEQGSGQLETIEREEVNDSGQDRVCGSVGEAQAASETEEGSDVLSGSS